MLTMDHVAPAVSHMVAKKRASHRSNQPVHAMRVLAVAAALPIVAAGRWECPAGSISGSHGVAACCPAACGHCGGRGCEDRAGGRQSCCALDIQMAGRSCNGTAPPCVPLGRAEPGERTKPRVHDEAADYEHYGSAGNLWKRFGRQGTQYGKRNSLMASVIAMAAPRRVFEFAGNGGFLMQRALLEVGARSRLVDWVHSDFALASLEYPIALVSDLAILRDLTADVDKAVARRRSSPSARVALPFSRMVSLDAAVEGAPAHPINITICQVDVRSPPFDLSTFDMVVTISFEHILEDIKVIQMLSVGTQFIFGVATFRHPEHHRHFTSAAAVHKRYCSLLNITAVYQVTGTRIDNTKVVAAGIRSAFSTCDFRADHADWNTWGKGKGDQNTAGSAAKVRSAG